MYLLKSLKEGEWKLEIVNHFYAQNSEMEITFFYFLFF